METKIVTIIATVLLSLSAYAQTQTAPSTAPTGPSDAQIAAIFVAANTVDVEAGQLAQKKSTNTEVKKFAKQMVMDHSSVNKSAVDLVTKLKVTLEESVTSRSLKEGGEKNRTQLKNLKGKEFDKAYVDNEVTYHQAVIDAIDKTLMPAAQNAELKAMLVKVRPAFVAHLEHAKQMQTTLR